MVLLEKLWDDVLAGPQPERGLGKLRKLAATKPLNIHDLAAASMPSSPLTPTTPGTPSPHKDNVWRSVFNPGSNLATRGIGAAVFDKPEHPNSPTVYDWLYSGESRSQHR